jgi:hypothetical protein
VAHTIQCQNVKAASKSTNNYDFESILYFGFYLVHFCLEVHKIQSEAPVRFYFFTIRWLLVAKRAHNTTLQTHNNQRAATTLPSSGFALSLHD